MIILKDQYDGNDVILAKIDGNVIVSCGCQTFNSKIKKYIIERFDVEQKYIDAIENVLPNLQEEIDLIGLIKLNCRFFRFIPNPSEAVQLEVVKRNGDSIRFIPNPSEAVQLASVNQEADSIRFIPNPSEAVQLASVNQEADSIRSIPNPSEAVLDYLNLN